MEGVTHNVTVARHIPVGGGEPSAGWVCTCGDHGYGGTASDAAQQFAEHYALAKQQAAPKVRRNAPAHDGGRTLDIDTVRKSEQAVLLALRGDVGDGITDRTILTRAQGRRHIVASFGVFSDSRLRTARVELQRAGMVEPTVVVTSTHSTRKMQAYRLTDAGWRLADQIFDGAT